MARELYGSGTSLRGWDAGRLNVGLIDKEDSIQIPSNPKEEWGFSVEEAAAKLTEIMEEEEDVNITDRKKSPYYK